MRGAATGPTSFKAFYQPGQRNFAFLPANNRRKAAMGSDFEIYWNLAMEHIEKAFPWSKAYLHGVSPRAFGVAVCFLALAAGAVILYVLLGLMGAGADYYTSLAPTVGTVQAGFSLPIA
jgi:hypothetical protein